MQLFGKVLVTGGCGFIGSHMVDRLVRAGCECVVVDDLSSGRRDNIESWGTRKVELVQADIRKYAEIEGSFKGCDAVFHAAANVDVKRSMSDPLFDKQENVDGTLNVLDAMRKNDVKSIFFTSSSTVYGNAKIPTPETAAIEPASNYGATKAIGELFIKNYSRIYGFDATIMRLANIIGPRSRHGVIADFYMKLKADPTRLEILGDGKQTKSYLDIEDFVSSAIHLMGFGSPGAGKDAKPIANAGAKQDSRGKCETYNVGSEEKVMVLKIAKTVVDELGLKGVDFTYTGGKTGWHGDVPVMMLDIGKIKRTGWKPMVRIDQSMRSYVRWLKEADMKGVLDATKRPFRKIPSRKNIFEMMQEK